MDYRELASKVKQKFPGSYDDMDDMTLAKSVVAKHPEYSDVTFDSPMQQPTVAQPQETQAQGNPNLDFASKIVGQTPMGMAAQGVNSLMQGVGKVFTPFIPVGETVQNAVSPIFRGSRAVGVGVAKNMVAPFSGQTTPQDTANLANRMGEAYKPGFQPQGIVENIGATVGENAPTIAAQTLSPGIGGPLAFMAQQAAETGKVSPVPLAMTAAKPILQAGKYAGKKLFSATTGVSEPAIDARYNNPNLMESPTVTDLTHRLPQSLNTLSDQISEADKAAWKTLSKSYSPPGMGYAAEDRAIPKDVVQNILDSTKKELSVYGGGLVGKAAKQAAATIDSLSEDINNVGKYSGGKIKSLLGVNSSIPKNTFLPETTVKDIIQSLDSNINWGDETAKPLNAALEKARIGLDEVLKKQNPAYAKAMEPVAQKMDLLKRVQQQFNIKSRAGEGFVPGTATENNLNNVLNNNKSVVQQTLKDLGTHTNEDYLTNLQNSKYVKEFKPGMRAQGSRRTLFGTAVGGGIGHFTGSPTLGGMAGAGLGFMLDTQGGPIAGKIIDAVANIPGIDPRALKAISSVVPAIIASNAVDKLPDNANGYQTQNDSYQQEQPSNRNLGIQRSILKPTIPVRSIVPQFITNRDVSGDQPLDAGERPITKEMARKYWNQAKKEGLTGEAAKKRARELSNGNR